MSIVVRPTEPRKKVTPPRAYPAWLAKTLVDPNSPTPRHILEADEPNLEPWASRPIIAGETVGGSYPPPPAKYVPPPMVVQQTPKVLVKFRVLNITDKPIFGFSIRANDKNLITNNQGEAILEVYKGHDLAWSTGRESGWTIPHGAKRKLRMVGMVPMAQIFPIGDSTTILIYPESGEYRLNGRTYAPPITYTTS